LKTDDKNKLTNKQTTAPSLTEQQSLKII